MSSIDSATLTGARRRERSEARAAETRARWAAERVAAPSESRVRERRLPAAASADTVLTHNVWDDVNFSADERTTAETLIAAQPLAPSAASEQSVAAAARLWDEHYTVNPRNYHDRRYLQNEFPQLARLLTEGDGGPLLLEIGCGTGNTLLPLLQANPLARGLACDLSPLAVELVSERLRRENLCDRASAFVWDVAEPPPAEARTGGGADACLAIFTLSALAPEALPRALAHLRSCLRPGGRLLLRDYGRLDLKQLKFARAARGRLGGGHGCEWYARGDGTTALFLTTEAVSALAAEAGFEVEEVRYDRRLAVNRAEHTRMHRVWVVAVLRRPAEAPGESGGSALLRPATVILLATTAVALMAWLRGRGSR